VSWLIDCAAGCGKQTWAANIAELLDRRLDDEGWFSCGYCRERGVITKSRSLQDGSTWTCRYVGAIRLAKPGEPFQPVALLVGEPNGRMSVHLRYYVDHRPTGGKLKWGDGPGGGPVVGGHALVNLVHQLIDIGCLDRAEVMARLGAHTPGLRRETP
jgi:hypothetical protein